MALEKAQISDTHSLKGGGINPADWYIFSEQYLKKKICKFIFYLQ
jgi:hypothetical protein